jgi:hypothetical protein
MMTDHPISRYPVPTIDELPDDMRARIAAVQAKPALSPMCF